MGQKVNPVGFRTGVTRDWDARWFAKKSYGKQAIEDILLRKYLNHELGSADIARIEIEKAGDDSLRVILHSGNPGIVIGRKGQDIERLRKELAKKFKRNSVEVSVQEIKNPDLDATLVAKKIIEQIEKRANYKSAMKRAVEAARKAGARGIKIRCSGRLAGAEIAREEWARWGAVPLHTLRADIDFSRQEAYTTFGRIGAKVWICRGDVTGSVKKV